MHIRQLRAEDAKQYLELRLEGLKNNPEAFSASLEDEKKRSVEVYEERLQTQEGSFTYGAFIDGRLVGIVVLLLEEKLKLKHRANIVSMYVTPQVRGSGTGKLLLKSAVEKAISLPQIEQIHLMVASRNQRAVNLYKSAGFESYGTEIKALKYKGAYFDIDYMVLFLLEES